MGLIKNIEKHYRVKTSGEVASRYQEKEVVSSYISKRFKEPIGILKHKKQVTVLQKLADKSRIAKVLELACGPARLTADLKGDFDGLATDYSPEMLETAKKRLVGNKSWKVKRVDAFDPKIKNKFDMIFTFRFLRHLHEVERNKIYKNIYELLNKEGLFVLDAINERKARWIKLFGGKKRLVTFDKLYTLKELEEELRKNGFRVAKAIPTINSFFSQYTVSKFSKLFGMQRVGYVLVALMEKVKFFQNPWEWIVICRRE